MATSLPQVPPTRIDFTPEDQEWIANRIKDVLASGRLTLGAFGEQFEREFTNLTGSRHAIAVNSGTASLEIMLRAMDVAGKDVLIEHGGEGRHGLELQQQQIADLQAQGLVIDRQADIDFAGPAMADGIGDAFLDDAVEGNGDVVGQTVDGLVEQQLEAGVALGTAVPVVGQLLQAGTQAEFLQTQRAQTVQVPLRSQPPG